MRYQQFGVMVIKLKGNLNRRLLLSFLGIIVITFILTAIVYMTVSKQFIIKQTKEDLKFTGEIIEENYIQFITRYQKQNLGETLKYARLISDIEMFDTFMSMETLVINKNQEIIHPRSGWTLERLENVKSKALQASDEYIYFEYNIQNDQIQSEQVPVEKLVLLKRYDDISKFRNLGLRAFLISFSISGVVAVIMSIMMSKRITQPIARLENSISNYHKDKVPVEVYQSNDEIELLARNFKDLTLKLNDMDDRQKQFFQNSSHELKTPLMSIQGYAEAIKDGIVVGDDVNDSLEIIIAESQRLKRIVDDVIYLSKMDRLEEQLDLKMTNLKSIIDQAIEIIMPLVSSQKLELEILCSDDIQFTCDREMLKRVFINLLGNAARYARKKITVNVNLRENHLIIDVIDDGKGFKYGQEEQIFDRFHKGEQGGSGIGLALTKEIIEQHEGTIKAINKINFGAIFTIEFRV